MQTSMSLNYEPSSEQVTYEQMALDLQAEALGGPGGIPAWKEEAHGEGGAEGETLVFDDGMHDEEHFFEGLKGEGGGGADGGEGRVSFSRGSVESGGSGAEEGPAGTDDSGVDDDGTDTASERPNTAEVTSVQEQGDKAREAFVSTPPQGFIGWGVHILAGQDVCCTATMSEPAGFLQNSAPGWISQNTT